MPKVLHGSSAGISLKILVILLKVKVSRSLSFPSSRLSKKKGEKKKKKKKHKKRIYNTGVKRGTEGFSELKIVCCATD